jgi:polyisoprenoid-binding protein YceI
MQRLIRRTLTFAALAVAIAAAPSGATEVEILLAPEATSISFELKATMHTVHGTATLAGGAFTFDTESGVASGEAVVDAASAGTDNPKRDKKMHGSVLLSAEHPRIVLRAERLEGVLDLTGTSAVTLVGALELLGVSHPIRVPMTVTVDGDTARVDAAFSVPYVAWGLKDPSTFVLRVGKEVPVTIHADKVAVALVTSR